MQHVIHGVSNLGKSKVYYKYIYIIPSHFHVIKADPI